MKRTINAMEQSKRSNFPLVLDLQTFAGGGEPPEPTEPTEPTAPTEPTEPLKIFTQDELDRIVADRLARQAKKYADYDEKAARLTELEAAEAERKKAALTEQERLEAEKAEAEKKAQEAEQRAQSALSAANQRLIKAEFKLLAKEAGIRADALEDAYKLGDFSSAAVAEDGDVTGVKEAVEALVAGKPYLVAQEPKQPKIIGGGGGPSLSDEVKTLEQQLDEARKKRDFASVVEISNKIKGMKK